jgi:Domain of unknown function (DUF4278)
MELKYRGIRYMFKKSSASSMPIAGKYRGVPFCTQPETSGVKPDRLMYRGVAYRFPLDDMTHPLGMLNC